METISYNVRMYDMAAHDGPALTPGGRRRKCCHKPLEEILHSLRSGQVRSGHEMFARSSPSFLFTDNFSLSGFFCFSAVESVYSLFCCYSSTTVSPTIIRAMNLIYRFGYFLSLSRTLRSVCVPRTCPVVTRGPVNALRRSRIFIPALCDFYLSSGFACV